jgi:hypothetical protein
MNSIYINYSDFSANEDNIFQTSMDAANHVNSIPNDNSRVYTFVSNIHVANYFYIKLHSDGHIKSYYLNDIIKYRNTVINMNKDINLHIFEIFNWNMILNLHQLKISYKALSKFIIHPNTTKLNIEHIILDFISSFHNQEFVLALGYHKLCKELGLVNIFHPKYFDNRGRPKVYTNEQKHEQLQLSQIKYRQSVKGIETNKIRCKRYRDKKKMIQNDEK